MFALAHDRILAISCPRSEYREAAQSAALPPAVLPPALLPPAVLAVEHQAGLAHPEGLERPVEPERPAASVRPALRLPELVPRPADWFRRLR